MGRPVARARRRRRHRARERGRARDHPRGPRRRAVHRQRDQRLRGVRRLGRAVHARGGRAALRSAGGGDPRTGPRLRPGRPRDPLLDARDHRASQRGRQRARADQPGAADRARRQVRVGPQPLARAEQRAGRRRHGRDPEQAARVPGHREERRGESAVRGDVGRHDHSQVRLAPDPDVRGDGARRAADAVRHRREPGATPKPTASTRWSCSRGSTSSSSRTSS